MKFQCFCVPPESQLTGQRSGAGVGLAVLAAVGFFGGAVAMGSSNSCVLRGIFGGCQDEAKANAENIRVLDFQGSRTS